MKTNPNFILVKPSPVIMPESFGLRREPPRRPKDRQPDYMNKFDFHTLYYDLFEADGVITGIGPPMRNLREYIDNSSVHIDGEAAALDIVELDRIQITRFHTIGTGSRLLSIDHTLGNISCEIGRDLAAIFKGMNVVATKSKNNAISWICDWARFYVANHKVAGVVLYDNGSTEYVASDILDALRGVKGLQACAVIEWNYPWGSPGGVWAGRKAVPWDSDYCQYGAMEHARNRLLRDARSVINHDIDELLVAWDGRAAIDILEESGAAGIEYTGRWIETVGGPTSGEPRFFNFRYYDKNRAPCTKKWVVDPSLAKDATQWKLHSVAGLDLINTNTLSHRHFMGINKNWKHDRTKVAKYNTAKHLLDEQLAVSLARSFATPHALSQIGSAHAERFDHDEGARAFITTEPSGFPAYWRDTREHFSATLAPWLVSMITGSKVRNVYGDTTATDGVAATGASLNSLVNRNLTIWGSGVIGPFSEENSKDFRRHLPKQISAVRGQLTSRILGSIGVDVPRVYGDPALLLPRFYYPKVASEGVVICPDSQHRGIFVHAKNDDYCLLDTQKSPAEVVSKIANASCCISTSLIGLVVAQAYGVPWVWLRIVDCPTIGEDIPFEDFFTVVDREKVVRFDVKSSDIVSLNYRLLSDSAWLPKIDYRLDLLLDAFPSL